MIPDPNDDYVVTLAFNSAAMIGTGDRDLHDSARRLGVLTRAQLVARFRPSKLRSGVEPSA